MTINMNPKLSTRLSKIIDALSIREEQRILEIGCGTGAAAREIVRRVKNIYVLGIDRSAKAIEQSINGSRKEIASGKLHFHQAAIEEFDCSGLPAFDFAFAIRVGALDGRHPEIEERALKNIAKALKKGGKLFIDGGDPLREIDVSQYR